MNNTANNVVVADDQSLDLLNQVFQIPVNGLSGNVSAITDMLSIWTTILFTIAGAMVLFGMLTSLMNTAHQGEALGRRWNSMWTPLRAVFAIALLIPMGWFGNMNLAQKIIVMTAEGAASLADRVWTAAVPLVAFPVLKPVVTANENIVMGIAQGILCQEVKRGLPTTAQGELQISTNYSAKTSFSFSEFGLTSQVQGKMFFGTFSKPSGDCGSFNWIEPDASANAITKSVFTSFPIAVMRTEKVLRPLIRQMVLQVSKQNTTTISAADLNAGVEMFSQTMRTGSMGGYNSFSKSGANKALLLKGGWANAGAYAVKLSQMSNISLNSFNELPQFQIGSNFIGINADPAFSFVLIKLKKQFTTIIAVNPQKPVYTISGFEQRMKEVLKSDAYPSQRVIQIGNIAQNALTGFYAAAFGAKTLGAIAKSALRKVPMAGEAVQKFTGVLPDLVIPVTMTLFPIALLFSVIIPALPFIVFVAAVAGFVIAIAEALLAAPLWCLTWLDPESDKLVPDKAMKGFMTIFSIFIRPTLTIFGLVFGILIFNFVGKWAGDAVVGVNALFEPSLLGILFSIILYGMVILALAYMCAELIHTLPNAPLHWINFEGRDDGVKDMVSSTQRASSTTSGAASGSVGRGKGKGGGGGGKGGGKGGGGGGGVAETGVSPK